jgi:glucose-1-phosphate thymidylyltransferase
MTSRAIVLARGLGRRLREAGDDAALNQQQKRAADAGLKGMMPINGRPFLDYVLSTLADAGLTTVALIDAPGADPARAYYDQHPPGRVHLDFLVQQEALGTANAVLAAELWTAEPFIVVNSDNLYPSDVLTRLAALDEPGLPVFTRDELSSSGNIPADRIKSFALLETDAKGYLIRITEKPDAAQIAREGASAEISMNAWRFDRRIFEFARRVPRSARGEFELPDAVNAAIAAGVRFKTIPAAGPVLDLSRRSDAADLERRLAGITPHT